MKPYVLVMIMLNGNIYNKAHTTTVEKAWTFYTL